MYVFYRLHTQKDKRSVVQTWVIKSTQSRAVQRI